MQKDLIPNNITIGDIRRLKTRIQEEAKDIGDWKRIVKEFATERGLTDQEAIAIANSQL